MSLNNIHFILCRTQLGENIGFTARALKNFNISNLRIVNPRCVWPNQKALATAVGAKNVLQSANIYNSIDGAIGDLDIILDFPDLSETIIFLELPTSSGFICSYVFGSF